MALRFPQQYVQVNQLPSGTLAVPTGTAPQQANGSSLDSGLVGIDGALCAIVYAQASTTSITLSAKWQIFVGGVWIDAVSPQNSANTALVTGSGVYGTPTTVTKAIDAPKSATAGSHLCRVVVYSASATSSAATETCTIAYEYRSPTNSLGS